MKYSKEERRKHLENWKESGKNAWAYAKENGLKQQTFAKWVKAEKEEESGFVEIKTKIPQLSEILIEKGDVKIHIPLGLSENPKWGCWNMTTERIARIYLKNILL